MDEPQRRTLDSIPKILPHMIRKTPFGLIVSDMQHSGFHKWGFVIYRGAYSDDETWQRYMDEMKRQIQDGLDTDGLDTDGPKELLPQYLDYTVIEDVRLEGASKNEIRKGFRKWAANRSVKRDGPGVDSPFARDMPRFSYCLYVDQTCLNTLVSYENWCKQGRPGFFPGLICAIIDVHCNAPGRHGDGFPEVEGCTKWYTGWMYLALDLIPGLYDWLSEDRLDTETEYVRPPRVYSTKETLRASGELVRE